MQNEDPLKSEYGRVAFAFARALAERRFTDAYTMLSASCRDEYPPERLCAEYDDMLLYVAPTSANEVRATGSMNSWPAKKDAEVGWAYIRISGPDNIHGGVWNEAVAVVVTEEDGHLLISEIEWGRP